MPVLTLTVGLPGCGKTTWANEAVRTAKSKTVIVNMDDIRETMSGSHKNYKFNSENEKYVQTVQCHAAYEAVQKKWNIIVADTNLNPKIREKWVAFAKEHGYTVQYKDFFQDFKKDKTFEHEYFAIRKFVKKCKEQNIQRSKAVPEEVIDRMADDYYYSTISSPSTDDSNLPEAIIVDMDGTVAHMWNRSPYETGPKLLDDKPDEEVILSVIAEQQYLGRDVIFMSGRKNAGREFSEQWLQNYSLPYEVLHMRADDDNRSDDIVKFELYMKHVFGKYKVCKVYDDRDQVVEMWRKLCGLKVLQVAPGNF